MNEMVPTKRARGERGSWFANVDGERLPCVHKYWVTGLHHCAKRASMNDPKHVELVEAVRSTGKVILTKDKVTGDGEAFERDGYIAVYRVDNLEWENDELEFDLVQKLAMLKNRL